jgi:PTH1 family peptidyl-tRNA hydrolase
MMIRGHNGLKSISQELGGTKDFLRIGIGIGRPEDRDPAVVAHYVLSAFSREEVVDLKEQVFPKILARLS